MRSFFITSSGTGIGKTFVTTALIRLFKEKGVHGIKPIITGWNDDDDNDTFRILDALELPHAEADKISLYKFKEPLSPNMSAKREGKVVDFDRVEEFCNSFNSNYLFIEGIGGVMTPLNSDTTILDLVDILAIPIIVVVGSYLGSLSHTLTTLESIRRRNLKIYSVIVSESENSFVSLNETVDTLKNFVFERIIPLPRIADPDKYSFDELKILKHD